jgi:hypothetical protein
MDFLPNKMNGSLRTQLRDHTFDCSDVKASPDEVGDRFSTTDFSTGIVSGHEASTNCFQKIKLRLGSFRIWFSGETVERCF